MVPKFCILEKKMNFSNELLSLILFIPGFYMVIKGADWLVEGAVSIARKLNISEIVIGLTLVSMGTSAPELGVNLIAAIKGNTDITLTNIIGSNIVNVSVGLGLAAAIYPLSVKQNTVWKEIPFSFLSSLVLLVMMSDEYLAEGENIIHRNEGIVLFFFFMIFMYYIYSIAQQDKSVFSELEEIKGEIGIGKSLLLIAAGIGALPLGGDWIVNGAVIIAKKLNLSESFIGLTIIAVGTSLPEIVTTTVAAVKKRIDIAVGNIIGSNIFNIFFVLSISAIISQLPVKKEIFMDSLVNSVIHILLFMFLFIGKRHILERSQGILFLITYVIYIIYRLYI